MMRSLLLFDPLQKAVREMDADSRLAKDPSKARQAVAVQIVTSAPKERRRHQDDDFHRDLG
ncbi:hypothetical protein CRV24_000880 [Beauveria bassiana]|nr:hypothetical protein CRV24_000880 [Beauveria bassiana]KAH8720560.1 hypothetical protein HC256_000951 [Beauveria bassiana]